MKRRVIRKALAGLAGARARHFDNGAILENRDIPALSAAYETRRPYAAVIRS